MGWARRRPRLARAIAFVRSRIAFLRGGSDALLPELVALRGQALAALGRRPEAEAERAILARDYPSYALAARAEFRIALIGQVNAGDLAAAAETARHRSPELPLSIRDEMLADLALAAAGSLSTEELDRVSDDLQENAALRAWVDGVARPLLATLEASRAGAGVPAAGT